MDTENYNGSGSALIVPVSWSSSWGELSFVLGFTKLHNRTQHRHLDSYYVQQAPAKHQVPLFPSRGKYPDDLELLPTTKDSHCQPLKFQLWLVPDCEQ